MGFYLTKLKTKNKQMKVAVIGATGLVGRKIIELLESREFPVTELILVASERSIGKLITFNGKNITVVSMQKALEKKPEIALFSAGGETSLNIAEAFANQKCYVVDNSSAWRMQANVPLVVPEINANTINKNSYIIANPNCSTIQLVLAISKLHLEYKIKRLVISTYQSISGSGQAALKQMENERAGIDGEKKYPYQIDRNCLPHCDDFLDNGYTKEEIKLVNESKKILADSSIQITATAVRVPVVGGHSESVNIEFERDFTLTNVKSIIKNTSGVILLDEPNNNIYPMPINAHNKDEVFVGRVRRDFSQKNTLNMWIVADNLRKGAATNAVQIAEYIASNIIE